MYHEFGSLFRFWWLRWIIVVALPACTDHYNLPTKYARWKGKNKRLELGPDSRFQICSIHRRLTSTPYALRHGSSVVPYTWKDMLVVSVVSYNLRLTYHFSKVSESINVSIPALQLPLNKNGHQIRDQRKKLPQYTYFHQESRSTENSSFVSTKFHINLPRFNISNLIVHLQNLRIPYASRRTILKRVKSISIRFAAALIPTLFL